MNLKKPLIMAALLLLGITAYANFSMANCDSMLTLSVNAALAEYHQDYRHCNEKHPMYLNDCLYEAGLGYNADINAALADYDICCCQNGLPCC